MSDWIVRAAVPEDEDCIASMWLRQLCSGQDAVAAGLRGAKVSGSPEQIAYWEQHQPIVTALLHGAQVRVACDPERATHEPGRPAVIWAWAVVDAASVYGFGVKRTVAAVDQGKLAKDIAYDLLKSELGRRVSTVLDLVDLARLKMIPAEWWRERGWASSLRQLSQRVIDRDSQMYTSVAQHILDPERKPWVPNERRAA